MIKVVNIATALPEYRYEQDKLVQWMHRHYDVEDKRLERMLKILYQRSEIDYRYSVLPDFSLNGKKPLLFSPSNNEPKVEDRMVVYQKYAVPLAEKAIKQAIQESHFEKHEITHLITVSCTGMSAPGIEIQLKEALQLDQKVSCYAINFVGCYAAFPALKMAEAFCKANPDSKVLICTVELCTIHFQNKITEDHLLSNALFADGAAACIVCSRDLSNHKGFLIKNFAQELLAQGSKDMAWDIHSEGFLMQLSSYVPKLVDKGIPLLLSRLFDISDVKSKVKHWAIHPGGKKILEYSEKAIGLQSESLIHSYDTLRMYGNLSSPTILFVLKAILDKKQASNNELCLALGFGPGLTMEAALLEVDE